MKNGGTLGHRLDRWLDECKMALSGIVLATREWRFLVAFALAFVIFGTLMSLLSGSTAALNLFWSVDVGGKFQILWNGFLSLFGVNRSFLDWLLTFFIVLLQSILIGLVVLVWQKRRRRRKAEQAVATLQNTNNVQDASLAAGLAILGSGCPTCGTTLLAPVIGTLFSSGGYFLAGLLSGLLTIASILLALFALKRIGKDAYIMITSERYERRHAATTSSSPTTNPKQEPPHGNRH